MLVKLSELFAILVSRVDLFLKFGQPCELRADQRYLNIIRFQQVVAEILYMTLAVTSLLFTISFFKFYAILAKYSLKFSTMNFSIFID